MKGCLKLGGDPTLKGYLIEVIRDIPDRVITKILEIHKLQEFKVAFPLQSWPKFECGRCGNLLYSAETIEEQMSWTHIYSSLVVEVDVENKVIYLLCWECANKINYDRIQYNQIHRGIA